MHNAHAMYCLQHTNATPVTRNTRPTPQQNQAPAPSPEFSHNPQDKVVFAPGTTTVEGFQYTNNTPQTAKSILNAPLEAKDGKFVFEQTEPGFHAANSFSSVAQTIKFFEEGTGMTINWSFNKPQLEVVPDGGEMINAYYQPANGNVNFFHATDPTTQQVVFSGDSGEVVSHEVGHAILDSFRPAYMYNWRSDVGAFHESFGDQMALLLSLQDERTLAKVVEQTGGDMRKANVAAQLGEELGITINNTVGHDATGGPYTRNAINSFTWKDPSTLEDNPKDPNELGSEVHNFSRLWTGAFYDVITGLVDENRAAGMDAATAIREASKEGLRMLGRLVAAAPKYDFTYKKMAEVFIRTDRDGNEGKHVDLLTNVFKKREILPASFKPSDVPAGDRNLGLTQDQGTEIELKRVPLFNAGGNFGGAQVEIVRDQENMGLEEDTSQADNVKRLISQGRILYTEPHQRITDKDLFDKNGQPYMGVLRWKDGQPVIERNRVVA